jgi:hypothetical protein
LQPVKDMSRKLKYDAPTQEESMPDSARWPLSLIMFLEYVIRRTWLPLLALFERLRAPGGRVHAPQPLRRSQA